MLFSNFLLTFHLAIDITLHQKTENQDEKTILKECSKKQQSNISQKLLVFNCIFAVLTQDWFSTLKFLLSEEARCSLPDEKLKQSWKKHFFTIFTGMEQDKHNYPSMDLFSAITLLITFAYCTVC